MTRAAFIHSPEMERFVYPPQCPFNVSRAGKVRAIVKSLGLLGGTDKIEVAPRAADRRTLKKFHTARYLHVLKNAADGRWDADALSMGIGTPDCPVFKDMYDYSVMACGATVTGVELILSGKSDNVFNPSGGLHHAGPEMASGFCYLNDVAIGCMVLAEKCERVLYLDVDVHHGDGVQNAFYDRSDVMTISFHESPRTLFPGTGFVDEIGTGAGVGYSVNVPLPVGTYDEVYLKAFEEAAKPLIAAYAPEVIVLELGADGLGGDPLANLQLTNNAYAEIIRYLMSLKKPILMTGGGGYDIENTARAWARGWSVLCGAEASWDEAEDIKKEQLKDCELEVSSQQRQIVTPAIEAVIEAVKSNVFGIHGL